MRLALLAVFALAVGPALAQSPDKSPARKSPTAGASAAYVGNADCMDLWQPDTHMTKHEWARTCQRVQGRLQEIRQIERETPRAPPSSKK